MRPMTLIVSSKRIQPAVKKLQCTRPCVVEPAVTESYIPRETATLALPEPLSISIILYSLTNVYTIR